jgi:nicotinamidase-related amidase
MPPIQLPVRWYPTVTEPDVPCLETSLSYRHATWPLKPEQTALVLVDCWDTHPIETHLQNSGHIIRDVIQPVMEACRQLGIAVIHAPSPPQARLYPQWVRYAGDQDLGFSTNGATTPWPPPEFRSRSGEWEALKRPHYLRPVDEYLTCRRIVPEIEPVDGDFVVANGPQLHRLCHHRELLHLLYAGFAANMCVLFRDYGMWLMSQRGYNCILLRDATVGIEAAHTYAQRGLTEAAILAVEMIFGTSTTSAELLAACQAAQEGDGEPKATAGGGGSARSRSSRTRRGSGSGAAR